MSGLPPPSAAAAPVPRDAHAPAFDLIELFFFAYRDFVADPDRVLAEFGFGRAHHRVLHFVFRQPGMAIADLLDVLKITKQSLNRVLKELVDKGFVVQRTGRTDRRQRLLYPTDSGRELALRMSRLQTRRIESALLDIAGSDAADAVEVFLLGMIDPAERPKVHARMARARKGG